MTADALAAALGAVDWSANIAKFLEDAASTEAVKKANTRLAVWSRQFEHVDKGNPALCFVREMQVAGHHVAALTALGLYKPAAAAMRAMLETALYYTYFRTHSSELATLIRDPRFYVEKGEIVEFHKHHTADFTSLQQKMGLVGKLEKWYGSVSSIVHGQIPGTWVEHKALSAIAFVKPTLDIVIVTFAQGEEIVHQLFLCTVGRELWSNFSSPAKKHLVAGLHGDLKAALGLDSA